MVYGNADSGRDALTEEKYKELANAFVMQHYGVTMFCQSLTGILNYKVQMRRDG